MLEEKNGNLLAADGALEMTSENVESIKNEVVETENSTMKIENEGDENTVFEDENIVETTDENVQVVNVTDAISESSAEESDDESHEATHEVLNIDYENLSMEELVASLEKWTDDENVLSFKNQIEAVKAVFLAKYNDFIETKKTEFEAENTNGTEEFQFHYPLKSKFDLLYNQFRDKRNKHFKGLENDLKSNLEKRLSIVEELKNLINPQESIKDTLKHFNELREQWKTAGSIPKDKYNHVWNNYHFHVENFYDYLHLDREARDLDFKHNLDLKLKIIARVEVLVLEDDVNKSFRELQDLHKIWKEDIGPVSREHRDSIWDKFSALTKQMHDKREVLFGALRASESENLIKKNEIIAQIVAFASDKAVAHNLWQVQAEKVETLRTAFFAIGKVPSEVNEVTWTAFKNAVRDFNIVKNSFYKDIKKEQNDNLTKKAALVAKAIALQESDDFAATTPIMKQIQEEWKGIGHVPRKNSDKIWSEFKTACNHYFEKLKAQKTESNQEEIDAFDKKKAYLESLKDFEMTGAHKTDLDAIKLHIENWKILGKVPVTRRHIDGKFNKLLDVLFDKLSLSKKDSEMMRFSNRMENLSESNDTRKLENEKIFLTRKIEEVQQEILQLENNIQFFTNTKNAKKENSIVLEVRKNIAIHKESLEVWKEKLKQLRMINQ